MAAQVHLTGGAVPNAPSAGIAAIYTPSGAIVDDNGMGVGGRVRSLDNAGATQDLTSHAFRNIIRNSGMWFAQRQPPTVATTYSSLAGRALSADGWGITNENASATYQRQDTSGAAITGLQGRFYGSFVKITASGKLAISQVIEGADAMQWRNRRLRLQLWMRGIGGAQTMRIALWYLNTAGTLDTIPATFISAFNGAGTDPTLGANMSRMAQDVGTDNTTGNGFSATCNVTTSWQRFGCVFSTVGVDFKNLIPIIYSNGQITATQGVDVAQVSLTDGYEIQDWNPMSYAAELVRVRRFYQKSFNVDQGPITNAGINTGEAKAIAGKAGAVANAGFIAVRFDVPLRTGGGTVLYNPGAANALMRNVTGAADMGATSVTANQNSDMLINATGVAATAVGDQVSIHFTSDAEL